MGLFGERWRVCAAIFAVALLSGCTESTAVDQAPTTTPSSSLEGALPLGRTGTILHAGSYCHYLQMVTPGTNALPIKNGCQFYLTSPSDLFATDAENYSVSEVVGSASIYVSGPPDAKALVICRLTGVAQFWFWISADGRWNIDQVNDIHKPKDLVAAADVDSMRQYVNIGTKPNNIDFKCAGNATSHVISLAMNVNDHQLSALTVPVPAMSTPPPRSSTPWFVDLGARLTTAGTLNVSVAKVMLYDRE